MPNVKFILQMGGWNFRLWISLKFHLTVVMGGPWHAPNICWTMLAANPTWILCLSARFDVGSVWSWRTFSKGKVGGNVTKGSAKLGQPIKGGYSGADCKKSAPCWWCFFIYFKWQVTLVPMLQLARLTCLPRKLDFASSTLTFLLSFHFCIFNGEYCGALA